MASGSNLGSDSDEGRGVGRCTNRYQSMTLPVAGGASADGNGIGWARESANHTYSKGIHANWCFMLYVNFCRAFL